MKLLIATDACLEAYNLYYGTPLHVACANDYPDCVKVLLNAGERATLHVVRRCSATSKHRIFHFSLLIVFIRDIYLLYYSF